MSKSNKFGVFGGVFTPSVLTILGVIMYMRLPRLIGDGGLWVVLGVILAAHVISNTTGLSVSSIETDKKVAAGRLRLVLPTAPGTCATFDDVPETIIKQAIDALRE